jgi:glutamyl-tRNA synthetase
VAQKITHVIRGEDHISNTPKQLLVYKALGFTPPTFAHLPLILGPSGGKLSKRDCAVTVTEYCAQGFLPEALFNYLVRLGWSQGDQEVFDRKQLVKDFDIARVNKAGAKFDLKKLSWLNGVYLREASATELLQHIKEMDDSAAATLERVWPHDELDALLDLYKSRAISLRTVADDIISLANDPSELDLTKLDKWRSDKTALLLDDFVKELQEHPEADSQHIMELAKNITQAHDCKLVELAQALRLALTGGTTSPGIFEIMQVVKSKNLLNRIKTLKGTIT